MNVETQELRPRTYRDLSETDRAEIVQLYREGTTLKEIVAAYNLKHHTIVCDPAKKAGIPRRNPQTHPPRRQASTPQPSLEERKAQLEAQLAEVQNQIAEKQIRFQWAEARNIGIGSNKTYVETGDSCEDIVIVHGFGPNFRKLGGFQKLLEWYLGHYPRESDYGARVDGGVR